MSFYQFSMPISDLFRHFFKLYGALSDETFVAHKKNISFQKTQNLKYASWSKTNCTLLSQFLTANSDLLRHSLYLHCALIGEQEEKFLHGEIFLPNGPNFYIGMDLSPLLRSPNLGCPRKRPRNSGQFINSQETHSKPEKIPNKICKSQGILPQDKPLSVHLALGITRSFEIRISLKY